MRLVGFECNECGKQEIIRRRITAPKNPPEGWITFDKWDSLNSGTSMIHFCSTECLAKDKAKRDERRRRRGQVAHRRWHSGTLA